MSPGRRRPATISGCEQPPQVIGRRLPWWSLLVGIWIAAGYWPLTAEARLLVAQTLFVVGALSVTLAVATIASQWWTATARCWRRRCRSAV